MNESSLVVLTQNAWGGAPLWPQRRERLARAIADLGPDVIGLQEIHAPTARGDGSQAHELAELQAFSARERHRSGSAGAVLMGDFNAPPQEPALRALAAAGWIDAWHHRSPDARGGTWPAGAPFQRIDYVWVQPGAGWVVAECRRTAVSGSDHVGVVALVRWPAAG